MTIQVMLAKGAVASEVARPLGSARVWFATTRDECDLGNVVGDERAGRLIRNNCNKIVRLTRGKMTGLDNLWSPESPVRGQVSKATHFECECQSGSWPISNLIDHGTTQ